MTPNLEEVADDSANFTTPAATRPGFGCKVLQGFHYLLAKEIGTPSLFSSQEVNSN